MNTGQTMLTILALALLSVITMRYYSTMGMSGRNISTTNAAFTATTVATSVLELIENCGFDAYTDTATTAKDSTRFTKPNALTFEAVNGENDSLWRNYDDIDDFNGRTLEITPGWMNEVYKAYVKVYYVNPYGDISVPVTSAPTYLKRIDVKVWRSYPVVDTKESIFDTVRVSNLHGYFFYNPL
jgi:hypothetical protein